MERLPCRSGHRNVAGQTGEYIRIFRATMALHQESDSTLYALEKQQSSSPGVTQPGARLFVHKRMHPQPRFLTTNRQVGEGTRDSDGLRSDRDERHTDISKDQLRDLQVREIMSSVPFESPNARLLLMSRPGRLFRIPPSCLQGTYLSLAVIFPQLSQASSHLITGPLIRPRLKLFRQALVITLGLLQLFRSRIEAIDGKALFLVLVASRSSRSSPPFVSWISKSRRAAIFHIN
ncbi:hypothetical protein Landi51_00383 [Colletotrichum acutatum]